MFGFFRDYYVDNTDDIMAEIKKNKHLSYYLQFTQRKADLKNKQWWKGLDPPKTYALTSNGIFQQPLLVLLGEILPQNILKKLKKTNLHIFLAKYYLKLALIYLFLCLSL